MNFDRYIGIDYSCAQTPTASLKGLRVYIANQASPPVEVLGRRIQAISRVAETHVSCSLLRRCSERVHPAVEVGDAGGPSTFRTSCTSAGGIPDKIVVMSAGLEPSRLTWSTSRNKIETFLWLVLPTAD